MGNASSVNTCVSEQTLSFLSFLPLLQRLASDETVLCKAQLISCRDLRELLSWGRRGEWGIHHPLIASHLWFFSSEAPIWFSNAANTKLKVRAGRWLFPWQADLLTSAAASVLFISRPEMLCTKPRALTQPFPGLCRPRPRAGK